jgi:uncharacterized RDD family membrane protein YckC
MPLRWYTRSDEASVEKGPFERTLIVRARDSGLLSDRALLRREDETTWSTLAWHPTFHSAQRADGSSDDDIGAHPPSAPSPTSIVIAGGAELNPYAPPAESSPAQPFGEGLFSSKPIEWTRSVDAPPAPRATRLFAWVIDTFLLIASLFLGLPFAGSSDGGLRVALSAIGFLSMLVVRWYLVSTTGQSLAKRWLHIKIVKVDGSAVGFISGVVMREWVPAIIPGFGSLDAIWIFGQEARCLHDLLAGTKVVVVR